MRRFGQFVLCAALLTGGFAIAHEGDEIDEIVVKWRWDRPFGMAVSASEGVVGQAELDIRPRLRTGDMLEVVPGLIMTQHSGSGKSNQMFLRGFNLDHGTDFATWIDGMPINQPTHGHGQGYTDLNFIIPELVDTLEFRKGPYYAEVQDFSSAGAAFFSVASKLDAPIIKLGLGESGFGRLLLADSFESERGDLLVGLQGHGYDGPWVGVSEDLESYTGLARYSEIGDAGEWSLMFMGYDASWDSADQVPRRAVDSGIVSPLGTIDDTVGGSTSRYSLSARWHRDLETSGALTVRAYAIDYELDLYSNFTYFLDDSDSGDQFQQVDDRTTWGGDILWKRPLGRDTTHNLGLNLRTDDIDEVGLFHTTARQRTGTVRQDHVLQWNTGLFYDIDHRFNDRWRGTLGVRADWFDFDVRDSNVASNAGERSDAIVSRTRVLMSGSGVVLI